MKFDKNRKLIATKSINRYGHVIVRKYYSDKTTVTTIKFDLAIGEPQMRMMALKMNLLDDPLSHDFYSWTITVKKFKTHQKFIVDRSVLDFDDKSRATRRW